MIPLNVFTSNFYRDLKLYIISFRDEDSYFNRFILDIFISYIRKINKFFLQNDIRDPNLHFYLDMNNIQNDSNLQFYIFTY